MRSLLTPAFWKGFLGTLVALVLANLVWHVYQDHVAVHDLTRWAHEVVMPRLPKLP